MARALKLQVTVGHDHVVKLPSEFPEGPAELVIVSAARSAAPNRGQGSDAERCNRGEITIAADFDEPLPPHIQSSFEGGEGDVG